MEKAIIISRCSTNESRQDVTRQSLELRSNYSGSYQIIKEFSYYLSVTKNDDINAEILEYAIANYSMELSISSSKSFGDFSRVSFDSNSVCLQIIAS